MTFCFFLRRQSARVLTEFAVFQNFYRNLECTHDVLHADVSIHCRISMITSKRIMNVNEVSVVFKVIVESFELICQSLSFMMLYYSMTYNLIYTESLASDKSFVTLKL